MVNDQRIPQFTGAGLSNIAHLGTWTPPITRMANSTTEPGPSIGVLSCLAHAENSTEPWKRGNMPLPLRGTRGS